MIRLEQISHAFDGVPVLQKIDLHAEPGATLALIGPSGCGKSTLLRILAGLVVPDSGTATVADIAVTPETLMQVRDQLGYVIQDGGLFPHLTARDNVTIRARLAGWGTDRLHSRVAELAALTRFPDDGLDRLPAQLSGGQRQRVGMMRALMMDPPVLLLDEPLAALDPMIRRELQDDLQVIFAQLQKTVVLVTHDLHEAAWFSDNIALLHAGSVAQQGSAAQLSDAPASDFVRQFVRAQRTSAFGAV